MLGSVTRLANFLKLFATKFLVKLVPIFGNFLAYFKICRFLIKKLIWLTFGHILENLGYFLFQYLVTLIAGDRATKTWPNPENMGSIDRVE